MILMSDTGGGHRASADAIKAGFHILYGDKYEVRHVGRETVQACCQAALCPAACQPRRSAEDLQSTCQRPASTECAWEHCHSLVQLALSTAQPAQEGLAPSITLPLAAKLEGYRQSMCSRRGPAAHPG